MNTTRDDAAKMYAVDPLVYAHLLAPQELSQGLEMVTDNEEFGQQYPWQPMLLPIPALPVTVSLIVPSKLAIPSVAPNTPFGVSSAMEVDEEVVTPVDFSATLTDVGQLPSVKRSRNDENEGPARRRKFKGNKGAAPPIGFLFDNLQMTFPSAVSVGKKPTNNQDLEMLKMLHGHADDIMMEVDATGGVPFSSQIPQLPPLLSLSFAMDFGPAARRVQQASTNNLSFSELIGTNTGTDSFSFDMQSPASMEEFNGSVNEWVI